MLTLNRCSCDHCRYEKRHCVPIIPMSPYRLNNLASLYNRQGRFADAELLNLRSLTIQEKALGPDHSDVARTLYFLASKVAMLTPSH